MTPDASPCVATGFKVDDDSGVEVATTPAIGLDAEAAIADPALDGVDGAEGKGDACCCASVGASVAASPAAEKSCPACVEEAILGSEPWWLKAGVLLPLCVGRGLDITASSVMLLDGLAPSDMRDTCTTACCCWIDTGCSLRRSVLRWRVSVSLVCS